MLPCVSLNAASTLSFMNVFQHSLGVLNFASRGGQIVQTEVMDRTTAETFCLWVSFSCKTEMSFRKRCFLIVADERNIPPNRQQRGPFTAKSQTRLQVNMGEQRPTLTRVGKTTGRQKWAKSKTACLQDLWKPRKGWPSLPRERCAKANEKNLFFFLKCF